MSFIENQITVGSLNGQPQGLLEPSTSDEDTSMPIAVIGIGGRFPGSASNPEKLWELLSQGRSALREVPKDRFNIDAFYHPHAERQGTLNLRGAHFLEGDVAAFDAPFFSITPSEAKSMDPQQRMILEVAYESIENAGLPMEMVLGSNTSCYVGCFTKDYSDMLSRDVENANMYHSTGNGSAMLSNRLSWFYDLKGPSLSLDTACSSSLVALHLACQSLRTGESSMSIVGGTNFMLMPDIMVMMTALHFLSPDSKCQSFDKKANGYAREEGAACVILKPLDAALRDGDVVRAVIRGTAVNQDGKTPGITLPSMQAQEDLIRTAYRNAGLGLADTAYFESHGTGTPAGDPLEAGSLGSTFGQARGPGNPIFVGSVKTNIGHMEGASGLAGLIKAVYALEKGAIPGNLWFEEANPRIKMDELNIKVPTKLTRWPSEGIRRVSVNSFGYGGTNAHVILDDALNYLKTHGLAGHHNTLELLQSSDASSIDSGVGTSPSYGDSSDTSYMSQDQVAPGSLDYFQNIRGTRVPKLVVMSSQEQGGLDRMRKVLATYIESKIEDHGDEALLKKLAYIMAQRRSRLAWKTFTVASTAKELCSTLSGQPLAKAVRSSQTPKLGFVFTGQGAQWHAMGRELSSHQVFWQSIVDADKYLKSLGCQWSLIEEIWRDEESTKINQATYSQPLCTALQVALVDLMVHWDIKPTCVVGHSSGEIAAAYCKGSITRESAWKLSYHRGRLSQNVKTLAPDLEGAMMSIGVGEEEAQEYLARVNQCRVVIACINSPSNVTLSGDVARITRLKTLLDADGIFARKLKIDIAYHSRHMMMISHAYLHSIEDLQVSDGDPKIAMFSSVTGKQIHSADLGAQYWVDNLVSPVRFLQAMQNLEEYTGSARKLRSDKNKPAVDMLVELGPHAALQGPLKQILAKTANISYISLLHRGNNANETALKAAGRLFALGYPVDIPKVNGPRAGPKGEVTATLVDLPPYLWNRSARYWFESQLAHCYRFRKHPRHDLFGAITPDSSTTEPRWRNFLRLSESPWIEDHRVQSSILYPAGGMIVMAIQAAHQTADETKEIVGFDLRDINIGKALIVPHDEDGVETMLQFRPWQIGSQSATASWQHFTISSRAKDQDWQYHCSGLICSRYRSSSQGPFPDEDDAENKHYRQEYNSVKSTCSKVGSPRQFYESLETIGLRYGPTFQNIVGITSGNYQGCCVLRIPDTKAVMPMKYEFPHVIHPSTLDNIFQMALPALTPINEPLHVAMVPTFLESLYVSSDISSTPGDQLYGYSVAGKPGFREAEATIVVADDAWKQPLVIVKNLRCTALSAMTENVVSTDSASNIRKLCAEFVWKEDIDLMSAEDAIKLFAHAADRYTHLNPIVIEELELGAFVYIERILKAFTSEQAKTFAPHLQLFYQWMQHQHELALKGAIEHQSPRIDWLNLSEDYQTELLQRVATDSVDGAMCRVGDHLERIMKSEIEPLQVMLEDDLLYKFYRDGVGMNESYAQLTEYLDKVAHKRPYLNILEIGAGTGGTTLPLLRVLGGENGTSPRFKSYTFTDISSGFFEKAQETFKTWAAFMNFKRLNVEEDPIAQGFQAGIYDVIFAANVLHATHSMDKTLANVRTLLKPGGKIVLAEITHMLQRFPMIVGCLPGWWMGEADGRKWGPSMTEGGWHDVLARQGFSGVDITMHEYPDPKDHTLAVMISTALPSPEVALPATVVIVQPASMDEELSGLSAEIARQLAEAEVSSSVVSLQDLHDYPLQGCSCVVLAEASSPLLYQIQPREFDAAKKVIRECINNLWVTKGATMDSQKPEANLMTGLGRTIRAENPSLSLATLDLDPNMPTANAINAKYILKVMSATSNSGSEKAPDWEYALRDSTVFITRMIVQREVNAMLDKLNVPSVAELHPFKQADRPLKLDIRVPGMLDTLQFVDDIDVANPLAHDDVEIEVKASGLNFVDIMITMGQISDSMLGAECSGVVRRIGDGVTKIQPGDRVMTWRLGCHQTYVRNPETMIHKIPDVMSFEIAASIPVIYCTVYHALIDGARLRRGESILIHAAAGGIGQAAIILSQHLEAEILVTVSSEEKKALLMKKYAIPQDHIFNSRDLSFAKGVMRMTNGRGVDVVLNSLAGEALRKTWHCTAMFGRFVEIGKKDIVGNTGLDMAPFMKNISFLSVNLAGIYRHHVPLAAKVFQNVVELMHKGVVRAVEPLNVYNYSQMEDAFRTMQTGKHMGKIVLKPNDEDLVPTIPQRKRDVELDGQFTYLLAGGLGGLGRSIARWMVKHGARNIVFISRAGVQKSEARKLIEELQAKYVTVAVHACDISEPKQLKTVFDECARSMPPIRGILQAAMVLQDSTFENMTCDSFTAAIRPKVQGSWNLHLCAPQELDFFVMLSSSAGVGGSRGQGNYAAGNTYQDALAHYRRAHNLVASTIDVGMILDVGFVAENVEAIDNLKNWGFISIREEEFHLILAAAIRGIGTPSATVPAQLITGLGTGGMIKQSGADEPFWFSDAKFAHMRLVDTQSGAQEAHDGIQHLHALLQRVTSLAEASDVVCKAITDKLAKSMMMAIEDIDASKSVNVYGVDSLVAVELRNWIFRQMDADVSVFDILSNVPISVLSGKIAAKSGFLSAAVVEGAEA